MNDRSSPGRRLLDKLSGSPTVIGPGARFTGDLECNGPLVLNGIIKGDGRIAGLLQLSPGAHWDGNITAEDAIVGGRITGSLTIAGKLEIGRGAEIRGSVTARSLAIAQGAIVDGDIRVTGHEPVTRFEEKRTEDQLDLTR